MLFLWAVLSLHAQRKPSLIVSSVDTAGYPNIKALVRFVDTSQTNPYELRSADMAVFEDGLPLTQWSLNCPSTPSIVPLSSVLVMDVSGSMAGGSPTNMSLAIEAGSAWLDLLKGQSNCAIVSFDSHVYLNHDFSSDRQSLLRSLQKLAPQGGTDYAQGLYDEKVSGLQLLRSATNKAVLIFLTDGLGTCVAEKAISMARAVNAEVYCVCLRMTATDSLRRIATETGGKVFDHIESVAEAREAYLSIFSYASNTQACTLSWRSNRSCDTMRSLSVSLLPKALQVQRDFSSASADRNGLRCSPQSVRFPPQSPGVSKDTTIELIATADSTVLDSVGLNNNVFSLLPISLPRLLMKNERLSIGLRCTPTDSSKQFVEIKLYGNFCSAISAYARCGTARLQPKHQQLRLVHPNGGEHFLAGTRQNIRWNGVLADDTVRLEYSTDAGASWTLISDKASGLSYEWTLPNVVSSRCLVRAQMVERIGSQDSILVLPQAFNSAVLDIACSPEGDQFAAVSVQQLQLRSLWDGQKTMTPWTASAAVGGMSCVAWSSRTDQIAVAGSNGALLLNAMSAGVLDAFASSSVGQQRFSSCDFSDQGRFLLLASNLARVVAWKIEEPALPTNTFVNLSTTHSATIRSVRAHLFNASADTTRLNFVTASEDRKLCYNSVELSEQTGTLKVVNLQAGKESFGAADQLWSAGCSPLDSRYVGASLSGELILSSGGQATYATPVPKDAITQSVWSPDAKSIALGYNSGRIVIWDVATSSIVRQIDTVRATLLALRWDPSGSSVVAGYYDGTIVLWKLSAPVLQSDYSDANFSIEMPAIVTQSFVDFGTVLRQSTHDSLLSAALCIDPRSIASAWRIDSVLIVNDADSVFSIVSTPSTYRFDSTAFCFALELRCSPRSSGLKIADAEIHLNGQALRIPLRCTSIEPTLGLRSELIDFGQVSKGGTRDSLVDLSLHNPLQDTVELVSMRVDGPDTQQFKLLGATNSIVYPGQDLRIPLSFHALELGRSTASLRAELKLHSGGRIQSLELFRLLLGEGTCGVDSTIPVMQSVLRTPDQHLRLGEVSTIVVGLQPGIAPSLLAGPKRILVSYRSTTLSVLSPIVGASQRGERHEQWFSSQSETDSLLSLEVLPLLGDTTVLDLSVDSIVVEQSCGLRFAPQQIFITIENLCMAGGQVRLLQPTEATVMRTYVDSRDHLHLELTLAERGRSRIELYDLQGIPASISDTFSHDPGRCYRELDLSSLSTGVYFLVLQTPTERRSIKIQVIR